MINAFTIDVESRWMPDIVEMSRGTLEAMKYHGIGGTEYKYCERRKEWLLIEISPRVDLWGTIAKPAGVDVIYDCYLDMIGHRPTVNIGRQRDGVRWQCPASVGIGESDRLSYTYRGVPDGGVSNAERATELQWG